MDKSIFEKVLEIVAKWEEMEDEDEDEDGSEGEDVEEESRIGWNDLDLSKFLIYGAFTSSFCEFAVYPFDLLKTRLQMQGTPYARYTHYNCLRDAVVSIARKEGIRGFFRGAQVTVVGTVPTDVLYYGSYEFVRYSLREAYQKWYTYTNGVGPHVQTVSPLFNFAAGAFAEVASSIFWVPTDIVAQKMMVQGDKATKHHGSLSILKKIIEADGVRGLYRGYLPTISNFAFHSSCNFATYEYVRSKLYGHYILKGEKSTSEPSSGIMHQKWFLHLLSGTISGAVAGACSTPIDVVKTRLQVQNYYSRAVKKDAILPKHTTFWSMGKAIIKSEGLLALGKGMLPRVMHSAPNAAMTFFAYEFVKQKCQYELP